MKFSNNKKTTISTHAPRVRRDAFDVAVKLGIIISTHAPRVRRDDTSKAISISKTISTHAPRVRRDTRRGSPRS